MRHTATHTCIQERQTRKLQWNQLPRSLYEITIQNTLQLTATHCNTLHHTATHCNTCVYIGKADKKAAVEPAAKKPLRDHNTKHTATHYSTVQHTATHCNSLQHTAPHCNSLQHMCVHKKGRQESGRGTSCQEASTRSQYKTTLQHTATHCNTLHHTATHSDTCVYIGKTDKKAAAEPAAKKPQRDHTIHDVEGQDGAVSFSPSLSLSLSLSLSPSLSLSANRRVNVRV